MENDSIPLPILTDQQRADLIEGKPIELVPAPGPGKALVLEEDGHCKVTTL